eukprot:12855343-Prorocentrum_lima.AAC.1
MLAGANGDTQNMVKNNRTITPELLHDVIPACLQLIRVWDLVGSVTGLEPLVEMCCKIGLPGVMPTFMFDPLRWEVGAAAG